MGDRFYATVRGLSLPLLKTWLRLRVHGLEHIPSEGPMLVVANHASYLDPAVLGRACPRKLHFLIKRTVYETRGLRWFFRGMDAIPVSLEAADTAALRVGLRLLEGGHGVGVFPEGGRSVDGHLGEAKVGAALLAARSGCPVVPAAILGAHASMPMGAVWPRPGRVSVRFGPSFTVDSGVGRGARGRLDESARRMVAEIRALIEEPRLSVEASA